MALNSTWFRKNETRNKTTSTGIKSKEFFGLLWCVFHNNGHTRKLNKRQPEPTVPDILKNRSIQITCNNQNKKKW